MTAHCAVHGATESVAACGWCATRMCDECFRFVVASSPICVRCAHERATRARRQVSLGVFTLLVSVGGAALLGKRIADSEWSVPLALLTWVLGIALGLRLTFIGARGTRALPAVQRREDGAAAHA